MKLALAQMQMENSIEANRDKSIAFIHQAAEKEADLILFPELQLSPFFPQYAGRNADEYLMNIDDPSITAIQNACAESHISASVNFYIRENGKPYDMSLFINDSGSVVSKQKMIHIADAECFHEQDYYTPGEEGFSVFETRFGRIGIVVCFDRHYPESIRTEALKGADLILIPTANTKEEPSELFSWEVRVQAFQNSVLTAMCNRTGREGKMTFCGQSMICDENGNLIAAADDAEQLLIGEVDLSKASAARQSKPYTALRRTEFYE